MNIDVGWTLDPSPDGSDDDPIDAYICEDIIECLTTLATAIAPEMAEVDVFEGVDVEAICGVAGEVAQNGG